MPLLVFAGFVFGKWWGISIIGLNIVGLLGATYLQSKGINVFAIRGGS